jgi:hypothetical protein
VEALEDAKKVLEVQNDVLSSEVAETTEQNNKLVGHNNHKQKIHMHSKVGPPPHHLNSHIHISKPILLIPLKSMISTSVVS